MKNKKLLVSLAIVAAVVVIIVIMASAFSVRHVYPRYHKFNGEEDTIPSDGVPAAVIEKIAKGKSTVFLSKANFLAQVNAELRANPEYSKWYAFAVIKSFPNILNVHLVERKAIAKLMLSNGKVVYLDSFGCKVDEVPEDQCIDITSAFLTRDEAENKTDDGTFKFESAKDNMRLQYVLEAILATWQCYVEIEDMDNVLNAAKAFTFDNDGNMVITTSLGGTIKVLSPETDLSARLKKAYGVYYNPTVNVQGEEITVHKNGRITTHSK